MIRDFWVKNYLFIRDKQELSFLWCKCFWKVKYVDCFK